ncbi:hypothetical protein CK203_043078 [Vitis vinifera]|uniref:Uncharacterized protein n=1 Tax=Vitis vinifera TaxID=29760 RepID=A0A438GXF2_VITVI|nr:hypothetical protein CK203_043078 [Vitis vinifera]
MSEVVETTTTAQSEEIVRSQQSGELQNIQAAYRLDGKNYLKWSQLVRTVLKGKEKINHLMATHVCSWPHLRIFGMQSKNVFKARDAAQVYEVKVKTIAAKQGSKTVTEYANQLKTLWQELDHYRVIKTKCPEDAAILKDFIEQDRVYDFLVGLNQNLIK